MYCDKGNNSNFFLSVFSLTHYIAYLLLPINDKLMNCSFKVISQRNVSYVCLHTSY